MQVVVVELPGSAWPLLVVVLDVEFAEDKGREQNVRSSQSDTNLCVVGSMRSFAKEQFPPSGTTPALDDAARVRRNKQSTKRTIRAN